MRESIHSVNPTLLDVDEWHLPYVSREERMIQSIDVLVKCSAARCARVSYLNHDGSTPSIEKDLILYDRLVGSKPLHASPVEHQAPLTMMASYGAIILEDGTNTDMMWSMD
jgi:hypothetical protein